MHYLDAHVEPMSSGEAMAGSVSPWPLVRKGDQQHPVQTLQYLLQASSLDGELRYLAYKKPMLTS